MATLFINEQLDQHGTIETLKEDGTTKRTAVYRGGIGGISIYPATERFALADIIEGLAFEKVVGADACVKAVMIYQSMTETDVDGGNLRLSQWGRDSMALLHDGFIEMLNTEGMPAAPVSALRGTYAKYRPSIHRQVTHAAAGRWPDVLSLAGITVPKSPRQHSSCPAWAVLIVSASIIKGAVVISVNSAVPVMASTWLRRRQLCDTTEAARLVADVMGIDSRATEPTRRQPAREGSNKRLNASSASRSASNRKSSGRRAATG